MILLQLNQIKKSFVGNLIFDNLNITIQDTSKIALVGDNGVGKSTLLKIIAGLETYDDGNIIKKNNLSIGYLDQHTGLNSTNTIWAEMTKIFEHLKKIEDRLKKLETEMSQGNHSEQILKEYDKLQQQYSENNGYSYEADIRSILHGFKFYPEDYDKKISDLSGGQKTRLALAKMLIEHPDLLILDEPTNHLDIETLDWLESYLKNYSKAILIVSHDRYFLDKIVNEIYEISNHKMTHYKGNYQNFLTQKAQNFAILQKKYLEQQQQIKKEEEFIQKNIARSSTTKRAQSRQKKLDKLERIDKPLQITNNMTLNFKINKMSGDKVYTIEHADIGYDNQPLLKNINIDIKKHDHIAIIGQNGIGKSTLLKAINNQQLLINGNINIGTNVDVGYYDQEQANLNNQKTILQEIWDDNPTLNEIDLRNHLAHFLFKGEDINKTIHNLSGGEKARLSLAKLALKGHNTLLLDEPTNHLDLASKEILEQSLSEYEGTLIFISHDRYFINKLATKIIEITTTGMKIYYGNYDYYLEKKQEELEQTKYNNKDNPTTEKEQSKTNNNLSREQQKYRRQLEKKLKNIEQLINTQEEQLNQLNQEIMDKNIQNDIPKLKELHDKIDQITQELDINIQEWEELTLELEELK